MFEGIYNLVKSTIGVATHASQWLTSGFGNLVYHNPNFAPQEGQKKVAIVFVHGTADRACGGKNLAEGIIGSLPAYVNAVHLLGFENRLSGEGIEGYSEQLNGQLDEIDADEFILIGHSRGGAAAVLTAQRYTLGKIRQVIAICAPFNGSYLSLKSLGFFSQSLSDMSPASMFMAALRDEISTNPACEYHFFVGTNDWIVSKQGIVAGYVANNPDSVHVFKGHGHLSIMNSTTMKQKLVDVIEAAPAPQTPSPTI